MKKTYKIILAVSACVLLVSALIFTAFAAEAETYTGTVSGLNEKIAEAQNATEYKAKVAAFDAVNAYIPTVDPAEAGLADAMALLNTARFDYAKQLLADVDLELGTAKNGILVNKVNAFVKANPVDAATDGYTDFVTALETAVAEQKAAMQENLEELSSLVSIDEFDLETVMNQTVDTSGKGAVGYVLNTGGGPNFAAPNGGQDGDNRYIEVVYNVKAHTYVLFKALLGSDGLVFEFDFTTFGEMPNNSNGDGTLMLEHQSVTSYNGNKIYPRYLTFKPDGSLSIQGGKENVVSECYVKGEWTRFSVVIDPETAKTKIYMNYEFIGEGKSAAEGYTPSDIRIGSNSADGATSFAMDNVLAYHGTAVRSTTYIEDMSDADAFKFYVNALKDEELPVLGIKTAYEGATKLIGLFWLDDGTEEGKLLTDDAEICAAVAEYLAYDYEAVLNVIKSDNLAALKALVDKMTAVAPTLDNVAEREKLLADVEEFLTAHDGYIAEGDEYDGCMTSVSTTRGTIEDDKTANNFVNVVGRFDKAISLNSMRKYYQAATDYINNGLNLTVINKSGYEALKKAYDEYLGMKDRLDARIYSDNSGKIIQCMALIAEYDTEQEWKDNYEYVKKYVLIIRGIVYSGEYDKSYEGVDAALASYAPVNDYFYQDLQREHIAYITEVLEKFRTSNTYIEKLGYCSNITAYLETSDIDPNNEQINALKKTHQTYVDELEIQEAGYGGILRQNTVYFINAVELLSTMSDYAGKKAVYDKATEFYYAMNVGSDEAKAAIKIYNEVGAELKLIEESTREFIDGVALMDATLVGKDAFAQLMNLCELRENVDMAVEGAAEAVAEYLAVYNAYNDPCVAVNTEVGATTETAVNLRSGYGIDSFIAIIEELLG